MGILRVFAARIILSVVEILDGVSRVFPRLKVRMEDTQFGKLIDSAKFLLDIAYAGLVSWAFVLAGGSYKSAGLPGFVLVLAIGLGGVILRIRDARRTVDMMVV